MTRFITDPERDAIDVAQAKLTAKRARDNRARSRRSALTVIACAVLAFAVATLTGWYLGGHR